jgi:hypothetical protein
MNRQPFPEISFNNGFNTGLQPLDNRLSGTSALGSSNNLLVGQGISRPFGGYNSKGAGTGSRIMTQIGKDYGGIKDIGGTQGAGNAFEDIGRSIWGIGAGQVHRAGTNVAGMVLSSLLQVSLAVSGVYSAGTTYQAGLPQPSAPDVGIAATLGNGYTGVTSGAISVKIARLRLSTGGRSRASNTSAVIVPSRKSFRVTFPAASTGQDNWAVFVTQQGFGGVGVHFRLAYNGSLDIPESVVAAGTVDGIARSLEFDFQDGDLVAEQAYIDDYPPPAGTHAVRLENVMNVLGCYADSVSSPSSTNPGTCIAVSLPNFYESYKPRHLLYLPEQVVSVLSRPTDSYAWVGCRNSILTLQYVGLTDAPACSITTAFPNIGIAYPHNWTQFYGRICLFTSKGSLFILDEQGNLDAEFAAPVKNFIKSWQPVDTIVGFDPETNSVILANGGVSWAYCLDNNLWSDPVYAKDFGVAGTFLSCTTSDGKLIVSFNNSGTHTAYDYNAGASQSPISKISAQQGGIAAKNIYELLVSLHATKTSHPVAVALQRNLRPISARGSVSNASNTFTADAATFDSSIVNDKVFIYGENIGGAGVHYLSGKIGGYVSPTQVNITDLNGSALPAQATAANAFMLIGKYVKTVTLTRTGEQHLANLFPMLRDARSYQVGLWMMTDAVSGQFYSLTPIGTAQISTAALVL